MLAEALEGLRDQQFAVRVDGAGSRVPKFRHRIDDLLGLGREGKALLAVLLLRGPQTLGELRLRTERLFSFPTTEHVESALQELAEEVDRPLWTRLPQAPDRRKNATPISSQASHPPRPPYTHHPPRSLTPPSMPHENATSASHCSKPQ